MSGDGVTAGVHHSLAVRVVGSVADLVISPTTLLFVLNGVHVVQDDCTVLVAPAGSADWELSVVVVRAGRTPVL